MSRPLRSLVAISGDRQRAELLGALLMEENDYGVVFVESIGGGYSRIKEQTPDLVILYLEIGDVAAWQLLSMLKIESDLSDIPVVTTWAPRPKDSVVEHIASESVENLSSPYTPFK
jgi:CheY-like chemotaxis protein